MAIEITCDCGKGYRVSDGKAGKRFKCRDCGTLVRVPKANSNTGDADFGDADSRVDPEAEYVPALRRPGATSGSAKNKRGKEKKASSNSDRNRQTLVIGISIAGVILIGGVVCYFSGAKSLLFKSVPIMVLVASVGIYFVRDHLCRRWIREDIESYGGHVDRMSWRPLQGALFTRGWRRSKGSRFYQVEYTDREDQSQSSLCAVSFWGHTAWDGDIDDSPQLSEIGGCYPRLAAFVPLYLLSMGYATYCESVYTIWGQTSTGTVTHTEIFQTKRHGPFMSVQYTFNEADGTTRQGHWVFGLGIVGDRGICVGGELKVEYVPGAANWVRTSGESYKSWFKVGGWIVAVVGALFAVIKCMDHFDVFNLHSSRRKKRAAREPTNEG